MPHRLRLLAGTILIAFALMGCVTRFDPDTMQPRADADTPPIYATHTLGQTFVAARPRLSAIQVEWAALPDAPDSIILHLRTNPGDTVDLARVEIAAPRGDQPLARWDFTPIPDSANRSFYLLIEAPQARAERPLRLRSSTHDVYGPGAAFLDDAPLPGDLTFHAYYDYDLATLWGDLTNALGELWLILPAILLFFAPGFLALQGLPRARQQFDIWERAALAFGVSLALIPFALLWVTQLGGALSATIARGIFGSAGALAVVIVVARWRRQKPGFLDNTFARNLFSVRERGSSSAPGIILAKMLLGKPGFSPIGAVMAVILIAGLSVRLSAIRDLALPAWVDSVHHVLVARIIAETGRIPASYEPYLSGNDATYHYGFQAAVAAFAWLSGKSLPQAMLFVGQLFNALVALEMYLMTHWLTRRRWAGVFAALIVALISTMPAYYVSWGRYTQLAGLLILPVAAVFSIHAIQARDRRAAVVSVLTLAGLILTHYRVFAFYVCLVAAWWLIEWARQPRAWRARLQELAWLVASALAAMLSLMPWLMSVATNLWLRAFTTWGSASGAAAGDFAWEYVTSGFDRYVLTLGTLGTIVALLKRKPFAGILLVWVGALFVITNPFLLGLPGAGMINNVSMLIMWFMPLAIGCGFLGDELIGNWLTWLKGKWRVRCYAIVSIVLIALGVEGALNQTTIVNPDLVLAIESDRAALSWIETYAESDSRFLINATPWSGLYAGTDGGYWITPLTGRRTTTPPALYGLEKVELALHVTQLNQRVEELANDPAGLWALLRDEGVRYVYVGALGGALDPTMLSRAAGFRTRYANGRAYVFEVCAP